MKLVNVGGGFVVGVLAGIGAIIAWWVHDALRIEKAEKRLYELRKACN